MSEKQKAPPFQMAPPESNPNLGDEPVGTNWVADETGAPLVIGIPGQPGSSIGGLELGNRSRPPQPDTSHISRPANPFAKPDSPFKPEQPSWNLKKGARVPPPPPKVVEVTLFKPEEMIGAVPGWGELVKFIMEHGDKIVRAQYPNPPRHPDWGKDVDMGKGSVLGEFKPEGPWNFVDTVWKGVPVFQGKQCMVEHVKYGWIAWEDCVD